MLLIRIDVTEVKGSVETAHITYHAIDVGFEFDIFEALLVYTIFKLVRYKTNEESKLECCVCR